MSANSPSDNGPISEYGRGAVSPESEVSLFRNLQGAFRLGSSEFKKAFVFDETDYSFLHDRLILYLNLEKINVFLCCILIDKL